jgi:hypothetical protein
MRETKRRREAVAKRLHAPRLTCRGDHQISLGLSALGEFTARGEKPASAREIVN